MRRRLHLEVPERDRFVEALQVEEDVGVELSSRAERAERERVSKRLHCLVELAELLEGDSEAGPGDGHLGRELDGATERGGGLLVLLDREQPVAERDVRLRILGPELDLAHELDERVGPRAGRDRPTMRKRRTICSRFASA